MIRNLKVLGLALMATFAFSAVVASAASAQTTDGKLTSPNPFYLVGTDAETGNALTYPGEEQLVCPESHYRGEAVNSSNPIQPNASTITITPNYTNCSTGPGVHKATVTMNGCDYVFHIGETVGANQYALTADLVCAGNPVVVHVYFASGNENIKVCEIKFGEQAGLTGGTVTDNGNNTGTVSGTFTGIKASKSGLCGAGSTESAEYDVNVNLSGLDEAEEAAELSITH